MSIGRPLRTAPKDGTAIILYGELRLPNQVGEQTVCKTFVIGGWCSIEGWLPHCGLPHGMRIEPDRWFPLPKALLENTALFNAPNLYINAEKCEDKSND